MPEKVLRERAVCEITGLPKSTLRDHVRAGIFPKPIKLGPRASGWLQSEVDAWLAGRVQDRDGRAV